MEKLTSEKDKINYLDQLLQLIQLLSKATKIKLTKVCLLMLITAALELISLGAIYPLLTAVTNQQILDEYTYLTYIATVLDLKTSIDKTILLATTFSLLALISGYVRVLSIKYQIKTSHIIGANLSVDILKKTLSRTYLDQINTNSSKIIAGITSKCDHLIMSGIYPSLVLINSAIILIVIVGTLIIINPFISLLSIFGFGATYFVVMHICKKGLSRDSIIVAHESERVIKILQESLGGIRDVILGGAEKIYVDTYRRACTSLQMSVANIQITSASPRYIIEPIGMTLISVLACILIAKSTNDEVIVPLLGIFAIAAQRTIPLLQQAYSAWSAIVGGSLSFKDALEMLSQPASLERDEDQHPLKFEKDIELKNITFSYKENGKKELNDINLVIKKGSRVGIIGETGGGKSTLVDCIMGLLLPKIGSIKIDGEPLTEKNKHLWHKNIAHVTQAIFLADTSVAENIAFGVPYNQIDFERVTKAAESAQILSVIKLWKNGFNEVIGERGVKISGGQRQRIGIARALYKKAELVVLDEATSALDLDTEKEVMSAIESSNKDKTIIIVAHRLETLKNCTEIIKMQNGKIVDIGSYENIILGVKNKYNEIR